MKSASKQIGALELSEKAAQMEKAGNEENSILIHQCTDEMLELYMGYLEILKPYFPEEQKEKSPSKVMEYTELWGYFDNIRTAGEELDFDTISDILDIMSEYIYEDNQAELLGQLQEAASEYDVDKCEEIMQVWEKLINA